MNEKKVEILSGDIGTVRNQLTGIMKNVSEIISLSQSVIEPKNMYGNSHLIVVMVYTEHAESQEDLKYKPNNTKEEYF
jgi:hypothetical protein